MDFFSSVSASFIVRWVHVLAMLVVVGGSTSLCIMFLSPPGERVSIHDDMRLRAARGYEWAFWTAIGVLVLTGVGNAGALAGHLPTPETLWGRKFLAKLFGAVLLLLVSLVRTCLVSQSGRVESARPGGPEAQMIGGGYAVSAFLAVAVLTLAVSLAHG
jgi:uncharacterized membrane protein